MKTALLALVVGAGLSVRASAAGPAAAKGKGQPQTDCTTNSANGKDAACAGHAPAPPACTAAPTVTLAITPASIWPPNKKFVPVTMTGKVTREPGCELRSATFQMLDEYGINQAGPLNVDGSGNFSVTIKVQAWRRGTDFDGRAYAFTAVAATQAGSGASNPAVSTVPHDKRR